MNRRVRIWLITGFGVATVLAVAGWILRATFEVLHGRGSETFISAKGLEVHWVDVLTMWIAVFAATVVIVVAMAIAAWRKKRDLAVIKKMGSPDGN